MPWFAAAAPIIAAGVSAAGGVAGALLTPKGGGTATQTAESGVGDDIKARERDNYDLAMTIGNNLKEPYSGDRVANMTPEQQELARQLYSRVGSTDPAYDRASGIANGLSGFNSGQLQSQYLRNTDLSPYLNPYTQQIIDPSLKIMDQSRQQALNQIGAQANQTGAFGGSRQAISEGVTNSDSALKQAQFGADLYSKNFLNAQQQAAGDIGRNWQEQTANLGARQWDANYQSQIANQIANLASGKQQSFLAGLQPAMTAQEGARTIQQQELDAAQQYYAEQRQQPLDVLKIRQNAFSAGAPAWSKQSSSTAPTGTSTSPLMAGLGTASTVAGLFGSLTKGIGKDSSNPSQYSYPTPAQSQAYPEFAPNLYTPSQ